MAGGLCRSADTRLSNRLALMLRLLSGGLAMLLLASALAGCQSFAGVGTGANSNPISPWPFDGRSVRTNLSPHLSALPSYTAVDDALSNAPVPGQYRVLRRRSSMPGGLQCAVGQALRLGKPGGGEQEGPSWPMHRPGAEHAAGLSCRQRTQQGRGGGYGSCSILWPRPRPTATSSIRALPESGHAEEELEQLRQSGLKMPSDQTTLRGRNSICSIAASSCNWRCAQMQRQVQQLCNFEADEMMPVWPEADLTVSVATIDVPAAIAEGLANRPDVVGLANAKRIAQCGYVASRPGGHAAIGSRIGHARW